MISISDFFTTTFQGSEYYMNKVAKETNVTSFQDICQRKGGYLVEINTEEEYSHLLSFLKTSIPEGRPNVMLGATDSDQEGKWVYMTSGKPANITKWYKGYGDKVGNRGETYNCMYIIWNENEGMHDWLCHRNRSMNFLCERDVGKYRCLIHICNNCNYVGFVFRTFSRFQRI